MVRGRSDWRQDRCSCTAEISVEGASHHKVDAVSGSVSEEPLATVRTLHLTTRVWHILRESVNILYLIVN